MSNPYQSFDPEEQQTMSEHVNRMLEILKDMSKSIARMQDSKDQIIEFLDKQSSVIWKSKNNQKFKDPIKFWRIKVMYSKHLQ